MTPLARHAEAIRRGAGGPPPPPFDPRRLSPQERIVRYGECGYPYVRDLKRRLEWERRHVRAE